MRPTICPSHPFTFRAVSGLLRQEKSAICELNHLRLKEVVPH